MVGKNVALPTLLDLTKPLGLGKVPVCNASFCPLYLTELLVVKVSGGKRDIFNPVG